MEVKKRSTPMTMLFYHQGTSREGQPLDAGMLEALFHQARSHDLLPRQVEGGGLVLEDGSGHTHFALYPQGAFGPATSTWMIGARELAQLEQLIAQDPAHPEADAAWQRWNERHHQAEQLHGHGSPQERAAATSCRMVKDTIAAARERHALVRVEIKAAGREGRA